MIEQSRPAKLSLLAGLLLLSSTALFGQSNYAAIRGTGADPQHRYIPGVSIRIESLTTGAERTVRSDDSGIFEFSGIAPGDYQVNAEARSFFPLKQIRRLEVGQQVNLDLILKPGSVNEAVEVLSQTEMLKVTDSSVGEVIEPKSIRELPLNGRMLIDFVLTVPGSHVSHGAQTGDMNPSYWRPGQRSAVSIGGNRPNANYFLLDGLSNTDPTFNTLNLSPSPDAVQEFKVQTGSYSAEMGGAGGGQVNIVTRSGTSHL